MRVEVSEEPLAALVHYASIPIAFKVESVFDVTDSSNDLGDLVLSDDPLKHTKLHELAFVPFRVIWWIVNCLLLSTLLSNSASRSQD